MFNLLNDSDLIAKQNINKTKRILLKCIYFVEKQFWGALAETDQITRSKSIIE
jgi:hypothetical protein